MFIQRGAIMKAAWASYRRDFGGVTGTNVFRAALRNAWRDAKYAAYVAMRNATETPAQRDVRTAKITLECKEFWNPEDRAEYNRLCSEHINIARDERLSWRDAT